MKKKGRAKGLAVVGGLLFACWLLFGIAPYLLHKSKWESYSFGDHADWIAATSSFYDLYYLFGVIGGWQYLVVSSALCFYAGVLKKAESTFARLVATFLFSFLIVISIAITRACVGSVIRVLE